MSNPTAPVVLSPPDPSIATRDPLLYRWLQDLLRLIGTGGGINPTQIDQSGIDLANLGEKNHSSLSAVQQWTTGTDTAGGKHVTDADMTGITAELATLTTETAALTAQVAAINTQISSLNSSVTTLNAQIASVNSQISALHVEDTNLQNQITANLTAQAAENTSLQNQINAITDRLNRAGIPP